MMKRFFHVTVEICLQVQYHQAIPLFLSTKVGFDGEGRRGSVDENESGIVGSGDGRAWRLRTTGGMRDGHVWQMGGLL